MFDKKAWSKVYAKKPEIKERERKKRQIPENKVKALLKTTTFGRTPYGKFMHQRKSAVHARGIVWNLTFEQWWKIWEDSGHWEKRGSKGDSYQMCRYGDEGPYSIDNVYIASHIQNKKDAVKNNKCPPPPRHKIFKGHLTKAQFLHLTPLIAIKELSELYGVSEIWARKLKRKYNEQDYLDSR